MKRFYIGGAALLLLAAIPIPDALTETRQAVTEQSERRERLFEQLKNARTEAAGRLAEDAIWQMWMAEAPSEAVRRDVKAAMDARESYDFAGALAILDRVVEAAPDYAEGWNQRAFVRFLQDDLDGSLEDLDRAIELEPKHFAALSGKAVIFMQQGRVELGQKALREAVEIHPWLKERSMLIPVPGEVTPGPGKDI